MHFTIFLSGVTCVVTIVISVSLTVTILVCVCALKWKAKGTPHSPIDTLSSIGTVSEYVEPLSSPSTNTERSLAISDSLSMQFNSSYLRSSGRRYSNASRVPPVHYEDPDQVIDENKNRYRPNIRQHFREINDPQMNSDHEHEYVTIIA